MEKWADYRLPLEAATQPAHPGRLGARSSLLALEAESLVFSSLRRSKAGALSLRFYDVLGTARNVKAKVGVDISSATKTRLDGEVLEKLELGSNRSSFAVSVAPRSRRWRSKDPETLEVSYI